MIHLPIASSNSNSNAYCLLYIGYIEDYLYNKGTTTINQALFSGTGAIVWLPQCQWTKLRLCSLALGQSYDCPSASEQSLNDKCIMNRYQTSTLHNIAGNVRIIPGGRTVYAVCIQHRLFQRSTLGSSSRDQSGASRDYGTVYIQPYLLTSDIL